MYLNLDAPIFYSLSCSQNFLQDVFSWSSPLDVKKPFQINLFHQFGLNKFHFNPLQHPPNLLCIKHLVFSCKFVRHNQLLNNISPHYFHHELHTKSRGIITLNNSFWKGSSKKASITYSFVNGCCNSSSSLNSCSSASYGYSSTTSSWPRISCSSSKFEIIITNVGVLVLKGHQRKYKTTSSSLFNFDFAHVAPKFFPLFFLVLVKPMVQCKWFMGAKLVLISIS